MAYRNFFQHWEQEVLSGRRTRELWTWLLNMHFAAETQTEARAKLEAWAAERGVRLRWEPTTNRAGRPDHWIHFSVLRPR